MTTYPVSALRAVVLNAQHLHLPNSDTPNPDLETIFQVIDRIGCVQIDTLQMIQRSQYLVPWSRLGSYKPEHLDSLIFGSERRLFEGWEHAATIIPLAEYRYQIPHQRNLREHPTNWYNRWLNENVNKDFVPKVLERIRNEGALKVSNFESDGHPGGSWWNWRPAKVALEYLYTFGDLMIANREKFQRAYDLTERILPGWVDKTEPTPEERDRFWVERGAKAMGIGLPRHAGDFSWMKVTRSRPIVNDLLKSGILLAVKGQTMDGKEADLVIHRDNLPLLKQAADGLLQTGRTTFLSPFDNLWWANRRDELFWGFHQALECYLPATKRVYGYFCLPILHHDQLVGRFDPKLDRKTGTLILRALYLEPGQKPTEQLINEVVAAMRDFMHFHHAKDLIIERSLPAVFGKKVFKLI